MSSIYSSVGRNPLSLPHLSQIIKLEPEKEPWCAGYAPSQGRRCHARTNAYGRMSAMNLLDEGTEGLRAGRCIDTLLDELAPHVLCVRFHQSQASALAARWKRQVHSFLSSQTSRTPDRGMARHPFPAVYSEPRPGSVDEECDILYQSIQAAMEELIRIQAGRRVAPAHLRREEPHTSGRVDASPATQSTDAGRLSGSSSIARTQAARPAVSPLVSTYSVTDSPARSSGLNGALRQNDSRATTRATVAVSRPALATRRAVEGDCGICLCALRRSRSERIDGTGDEDDDDESSDEESSEEEEEESEEESSDEGEKDETDHDDSSSYSSSSDDDDGDGDGDEDEDEDEDEEEQDLVWCKAQCGVNFHKHCIDQWLAASRFSSCPTCRSIWRGD